MNNLKENIANCYLYKYGQGICDNKVMDLHVQLNTIADRIYFYGDALTSIAHSDLAITDEAIETLGSMIMADSNAVKLVIEEYMLEHISDKETDNSVVSNIDTCANKEDG